MEILIWMTVLGLSVTFIVVTSVYIVNRCSPTNQLVKFIKKWIVDDDPYDKLP